MGFLKRIKNRCFGLPLKRGLNLPKQLKDKSNKNKDNIRNVYIELMKNQYFKIIVQRLT